MKLATIWTLRGMTLRERLARTTDWSAQRVAAALPKRVRYWSFIQAGGKAMPANAVVPEVTFMDVLAGVEGGPR